MTLHLLFLMPEIYFLQIAALSIFSFCHLTPVSSGHSITLPKIAGFFLLYFHFSTYHYVTQYILLIFLLYCCSSHKSKDSCVLFIDIPQARKTVPSIIGAQQIFVSYCMNCENSVPRDAKMETDIK